MIVLVNPPYIKPTTPPLGVAMLKGAVNCRCVDINIQFHNDFVSIVGSVDRAKLGKTQITLLEAAAFLKSSDALNDMDRLNHHVDMFYRMFRTLNIKMERICREYVAGKRTDIDMFDRYVRQIIDLTERTTDNTAKQDKNKHIIGLSVNYNDQIDNALGIAKRIKDVGKAQGKEIIIVFGGSAACTHKERLLQNNRFIDFVIYNQGEIALQKLAEQVEGKEEWKDVPNLVWRDDGEITINDEVITETFDITPDYSDFNLQDYYLPKPVLNVLSAKGCYWRRCAFCSHHNAYSNMYRAKDVVAFVDELEKHSKEHQVKHFYFVDEMISAPRLSTIADEILKRELDIRYCVLAKPTKDFTKDIFAKLHRSGLRMFLLGVESGCQRVLDVMDKGTNVKDVSAFLQDSHEADIKNCCYIVTGFPSETEEEIKETVTFVEKNKDNIDLLLYGHFSLNKGSIVFDNPEKFGIEILDSTINTYKSVSHDYKSNGLTRDESMKLSEKYHTAFQELNNNKQALITFREFMIILAN